MNLLQFVFSNKRVSLTLVVLMTLLGAQAYIALPKAEDPGFIVRQASVITQLPGANAQRMEELVSAVLEKSIVEMPQLDNVNSTSRNGVSILNVAFKATYTNMRPIFDELRRKVDAVSTDLPSGVIGPVVNDDKGDVYGIVYTLSGQGFSDPELKEEAENIRDQLLSLDDVGKIELQGLRDETIYVEYSDAKLRENGITANELAGAISNTNTISSGGRMLVGNERLSLEPSGDFSGVESLRTTVMRSANGDLLQLQDLARIDRVVADPPSEMVRARGSPAISINVNMRSGGDIVTLGAQIEPIIEQIQNSLPIGMVLEKTAFQADIVNANINDFLSSIAQAIAIVGGVLLLFLGVRTGLIIAASIPITMALTLMVMQWLGMTIDKVSLAGLIISLGLLVDNGIVIAESIQKRLQAGQERVFAAITTTDTMRIPLLVGSATTVAAFTPIVLAESAVGEFTAAIGYIVAITLSISWLMSMTIIPMVGGLLLKASDTPDDAPPNLMERAYGALLDKAIRFRWITIAVACLLFYSMILAMGSVRNEFIPPSDEPLVTVELDLPQGVDISTTERVSTGISNFLNSDEAREQGVTNWTQYIGISAPKFKLGYNPGNTDAAHMTALVNITESSRLDDVIALLQDHISSNYPDAQYKVARLAQGPPVSYPIQVRLSGRKLSELERLTAELKQQLYATNGVLDVIDDWGIRTRKIGVDINTDKANAVGLSNNDVANSLFAGISGNTVSELREGEDRIPVVLRSSNRDRSDLRRLPDLTVTSSTTAQSVPLAQVAQIDVNWEVPLIKRRNRVRTVTVSATLLPGFGATNINTSLKPWLNAWALPVGYSFEEGGESESSDEASQSIVDKLPIAGLMIVLLLIGQFNSFRKAAIVLMTIPLGLIGMSWGLSLTGVAFGFFTILGIISLAGIIINNAIILIDQIGIEENAGTEPREAISRASTQRLRPILLTTATTCGGMLPLALAPSMFQTMAVTLIFGMLVGTAITLLLVPAVYSLLFRVPGKTTAEPTAELTTAIDTRAEPAA
jgi:multidrug efflux pump subunit AcrB